jgi:hypothetical protein
MTLAMADLMCTPPTMALALFRSTFIDIHCTENPIYAFSEMKLHGLIPNSYIQVSVSDLYSIFTGSVCLFGCSKIVRSILGIYKLFTDT